MQLGTNVFPAFQPRTVSVLSDGGEHLATPSRHTALVVVGSGCSSAHSRSRTLLCEQCLCAKENIFPFVD